MPNTAFHRQNSYPYQTQQHQQQHEHHFHHYFDQNHQEFQSSINQPPPPLSESLDPPPTTTSSSGSSSTFSRNQHQQQQQQQNAKRPLNQQYHHQSTYQSFADIADPLSNPHLFIHVASGQKISRPWQSYISDLDDFFERVYYYYRKSGFACIVAGHLLELLEILLVVSLTFFFIHMVDYEILFRKKLPPNHPDPNTAPLKVTIGDCLVPFDQITVTTLETVLLIFAATFWVTKCGVAYYSISSNKAIRSFFIEALQIRDPSLYTWQEVQTRLIHAQSHCLLRESHLDELAIHNRLLRRANYMIALVNKGVLPIYYHLPLLGEYIYLTSGLEFNLNILLFRGVFSLFDKNWKLRADVKSPAERLECARRFSNRCILVGMINLVLLPFIFLWQSLYAFYTYVEAAKRDPSIFSSRTWSRYGRWFLRHFNELDHELDQRLNRAHRPATRYMNSFTAPLLEIFARFARFMAGTVFSVLLVLTFYDEDVITVEHVITLMAVLGAIIVIAGAFLPDVEPNRWNFAELDAAILQHIHYRPHNYPPHTVQARNAMANIFVYKFTQILEELISPLLVPYVLMQLLRKRSLEIVDFFRVYTLELADIGDVCTFSQFNFNQNGHRIFSQQPPKQPVLPGHVSSSNEMKNSQIPAQVLDDERNETRNGKLELSLINFKLKNPKWQPNDNSQMQFIDRFMRQSARDDATTSLVGPKFPPEESQMFGGGDLGESRSTIDFRSPTTSMFFAGGGGSMPPSQSQPPSGPSGAHQQQSTSQISDSHQTSSSYLLARDWAGLGFGFQEKRKQLMKLKYASMFSEQEECDNQMALSSLYFHQLATDAAGADLGLGGGGAKTNVDSDNRSSQQPHQQLSIQSKPSGSKPNESIPLLKRNDNYTKMMEEEDDDDGDLGPR